MYVYMMYMYIHVCTLIKVVDKSRIISCYMMYIITCIVGGGLSMSFMMKVSMRTYVRACMEERHSCPAGI